MRLGKIFKKTKTGATQQWEIEVEGNKYRTHSGQTGGKLTTNEWTVCYGKNVGRANSTTDEEQAEVEAIAKRTKKLESGYFEDVVNIDTKQYFEPMLAVKWEDYVDKIGYPIYSQAKLDGIRCILTKDGMFTRNGKPIISAPHIYESLKPLFETRPDLIFDGELYADKFANDFNKIVSLVKKTKPTADDLKESKELIQYHIYDLPSSDKNFLHRIYDLAILFETHRELHPHCRIVETYKVPSEDVVTELYERYVEGGYEGQMLRLDGKYENKRSKNLLKHKSFVDEEYTILDICEGEGNRTGTAGYMVFQTEDGNGFKSNIKGTFEYTKWVLEQRDSLIGKSATVKYFNLTPNGIPRFPYVISIDRID
jgi:DNA ligase-1